MSFLGGEMLEWVYSLALLVLGFVLVLLEIFVIPGINIFGIVGFLTAIAGIAYAYMNMGGLAAGVVAGLGLVGTAILVRLMLKVARLEPLGAQRWHDAQGRLRFGQARPRDIARADGPSGYDAAAGGAGRNLANG